jgi:hypothetical protein
MTNRARARAQAKLLIKLREIPIVAVAVKAAGVPRSTYYRWCNSDPIFAFAVLQALELGRDMINDLAESNIIRGVKDQDMAATKYWLSHNNNRYSVRPIFSPDPPDLRAELRERAVKGVEEAASSIHGDLVRRWMEDIDMAPKERQNELMMELIEYLRIVFKGTEAEDLYTVGEEPATED